MGKEQQLCSGSNLRCLKPALISLGLTTAPLLWGDFLQVVVLRRGSIPGFSNLREPWHPLEGSQNPRLQGPTSEGQLQLVRGRGLIN